MARPFQIKICGVTTPADARMVVACGADAIGLNFCLDSPRGMTVDAAKPVAEASVGILKVGVFVNATSETILHVAEQLELDWLQLHGDEPLELLGDLPPNRVVRAFRIRDSSLKPVRQFLADCDAKALPRPVLLLDAYQPGAYGGTGKTANWDDLVDWRDSFGDVSMVLAGGLHAGNVADAMRLVVPTAVDTASGVEKAPGVKDEEKVRAFVAAAKSGFQP